MTTALALAGAWASFILAGAWLRRPLPVRVPRLPDTPMRTPTRTRTGTRTPTPTAKPGDVEAGPAAALGRLLGGAVRSVLLRLGRAAPPPRPSVDAGRARRLGRAAAAGAAGLALFPPAAPLALVAVWGAPVLRERRRRREAAAEVLRSLPEVVDLFVLAAGAGLTVPLSVAAVARRASGPVADDLGRVLDEVRRGRRLADALETVPYRTGESTRPLIAALVASERYGAPLLDRLTRLAVEARSDRRRRAEAAARRVPVKLLFPLVCCTLPAFGLLTVVPLLAGALTALRP